MKHLFLASLLLVPACSAMTPSTLARLMALSPLEADPADIALQTSLPPGLGLIPGGSSLDLSFVNNAQSVDVQASYPILATTDADAVTTFQIDPSRHDDMAARQAQARTLEAADPDGTSGSLSLHLGLCRTRAPMAADALITVTLRTEAGGPYLPFLTDAPLSRVADEIADLPACPVPGTD